MRKKMIYSFIVGLIFYCVMGLSQAQAATLSLGSDITASPGEKVVVPVIFMPAAGENFTDLRFVIRFDSSIVTINPLLIDVRQGPVYPTGKSWTKKLTSYGDLSVFIYGGSTLITGGTAAIVTSSFTIIATGDTNLTFVAADGSDKDGNAFDVGTSGMWIKVQRPPVLDTIADQNVNEGSALSFTLHATDPDGDTLSYSMVNPPAKVPAGALNAASGLFTWTPGYDDAGSYALTFKADDGKGLSDTKGCTITVNNLNRAPVISAGPTPDHASINVNQTSQVTVTASDPDGSALTYTWSATGGTISGSGALVTYSAPNAAGSYTITVAVSDPQGLSATGTGVITVAPQPNRPPVLDTIADQNVNEGSALSFTLHATDPDGDTLSYSMVNPPAKVPAGALNGASGLFTWTPGYDDAGSYALTFKADDGKGLSDTKGCTITVNNLNRAQVISAGPTPDHASINVNQTSQVTVTASDPDGSALTYTWSATGGTISGSGALVTYSAPNAAGSYTITVAVSDPQGLSATGTGVITVAPQPNRPPVLDTIADQNVNEGSALSFTLHATDPDGDTLSYSMVNPPAKVPAGALNAASGLFTWTPGYDDAGSYALTFKADDGKGLSDTKGCTITVNNLNRAPVISAGPTPDPASINVNQTSQVTVTASDPDGSALTYTWSATGGTISGRGGVGA